MIGVESSLLLLELLPPRGNVGRGVGSCVGVNIGLRVVGIVVGVKLGLGVGSCAGVNVRVVGIVVGGKVGLGVGSTLGSMVGDGQPQALKHASDASRPSAPRTSQRLGKNAETHSQSFELSPLLYHVGSF